MKSGSLSLSGLALALAAASSEAHAHPGHGSNLMTSDSAAHWLVEPSHLAGWVALGVTLWSLHRVRLAQKQAVRERVVSNVKKP